MRWLAALLVVAACTSDSGNVRVASLSETFTLNYGQAAKLEAGPSVQFVGVGEDSRCPVDVQCVWQGNAAIVLEVRSGSDVARVTVNSAGGDQFPRSARAGGYTIELVDVRPEARQTRPVPEAYSVTLRVVR